MTYLSKKLPGWEIPCIEYIRQCSVSPFKPGKLDCGYFTGGALQIITGEPVLKGLKYRTIDAGLKLMNDRGFTDHIEYAASLYREWPSPLFAQRGDVAALEDETGQPVLGLVQGAGIYVMGINGLGIVPLTDAKRAFFV